MKKSKLLILLLLALVIGIISNGGFSGIVDHYSVNDEVRAGLHLMDDLPESRLKEYTKLGIPSTTSLVFVYKILTVFTDLVLTTKLLSIILLLVSVMFAYLLANALKLKYSFIFTTLFTLQMGAMFWIFSGATSKAFAIPLLLAFMFFLIKRKITALTIIMVLQALFYPPILIISLGVLGIEFLRKKISFSKVLPAIIPILVFIATIPRNHGFGSKVALKEAIMMPEFYSGARAPIFRGEIPFTNSLYDTLHSIFNSYNLNIHSPFYFDAFFILGIICIAVFLIYYKKVKVNSEITSLLATSLIIYILAFLTFSYLYLPSRYLIFVFPIVAIYYICRGLEISLRNSSNKRKAIALIIILLLAFAFYLPKVESTLVVCKDKELYNFIETLPEDTLIAAHPKTADCIPLYSKRNVLFMDELNAPYYKIYYEDTKSKNLAFFNAYYSNSADDICDFCNNYEVDYMVFNPEHFSEDYIEKAEFYREPFNSEIKDLVEKNDFILPDLTSNTPSYGKFKVFLCVCTDQE